MKYATIINTRPGDYPPNYRSQVWHQHDTREAAERDAAEARRKGYTAEVDEMVELAPVSQAPGSVNTLARELYGVSDADYYAEFPEPRTDE